jgi:hypothetical protein
MGRGMVKPRKSITMRATAPYCTNVATRSNRVSGFRDPTWCRVTEPHPLKLQQGIAVYPEDIGPRLPVLGLRALTQNQLHVAIDPERMRVSIRTPDWSTKTVGWLGRLL